MPPGKDGRARRRALGLDVVVVEADALAGHLVDARRGNRSAIYPESSPADIVHQNEHDVRPMPGWRRRCRLLRLHFLTHGVLLFLGIPRRLLTGAPIARSFGTSAPPACARVVYVSTI